MASWTQADLDRIYAGRHQPVTEAENAVARSSPQKAAKYRAVPCLVTEDLTMFTAADIAAAFTARRGCEPDDAWRAQSLHDRAQSENISGTWFGSLKEARRYIELKGRERAGTIRDLRLQPRYVLCGLVVDHADCRDVNAGTIANRRAPVGDYVGDFEYDERHGIVWTRVVEDTKGVRTAVYKLKKRLFETQYGIAIREV
jgi:Protein of unknown function (DUF1064)